MLVNIPYMDGYRVSQERFVCREKFPQKISASLDKADDNGWMARATHGHYVWALVG